MIMTGTLELVRPAEKKSLAQPIVDKDKISGGPVQVTLEKVDNLSQFANKTNQQQ